MNEEELKLQQRLLELEEEEAVAAQGAAKPAAPTQRMAAPDTPVSSPEAMARGLADVLTFGTAKYTAPAIRGGLQKVLPKSAAEFLNLQPYEAEKAKYAEREKIAEEYEPTSYMGGQALGLGAQIFGGGPLRAAGRMIGAGRVAAPEAVSAGRAAASRAFETPVGQAGVGALQAGAESEFDPSQMAKGAAIGAGITAAGSALSRFFQPSMERGAANWAAKATGADVAKPSKQIERMPGGREAYGRDVLQQGIVTGTRSVPEIAEVANQQRRQFGEEIGNIYNQLDAIEGGEVPQNYMPRLLNRIDREVIQPLNDVAATRGLARRVDNAYLNDLREMVEQGYQPSYTQLHREQSRLGNAAFAQGNFDAPVKNELRNIERIMREELQNQASRTGAGADLIDALRETNRRYAVATQAATTAREKARRMATNRTISLTDYLLGGAGAAAGGFGGGGVGALAGTAAGAILNKVMRERGPQAAAAMLDAAQRMAGNNPDRIGLYLNFLAGEKATKLVGGKEQ